MATKMVHAVSRVYMRTNIVTSRRMLLGVCTRLRCVCVQVSAELIGVAMPVDEMWCTGISRMSELYFASQQLESQFNCQNDCSA